MKAHNVEQFGPNPLSPAEDKQLHYYDAASDKFIFIPPPTGTSKVLGFNPGTSTYAWFEVITDVDYIYVNEVVPNPTYVPEDPGIPPEEVTPDVVLYQLDLRGLLDDYNVRFHLGTEHLDAGAYTLIFGDGSTNIVVEPDGTWDSVDHLFQKGYVYNVQITGSMAKLTVLAVLNADVPTQFVPITAMALPAELPALKTFAFMGTALPTWDFVTATNHQVLQCLEFSFNDNPSLVELPDFTNMPSLSFLRVTNDSITTPQLDTLLAQLEATLLTPGDTDLQYPLFPIHNDGHIYINNNAAPSVSGLNSISLLEARGWIVHLT